MGLGSWVRAQGPTGRSSQELLQATTLQAGCSQGASCPRRVSARLAVDGDSPQVSAGLGSAPEEGPLALTRTLSLTVTSWEPYAG